MFSTGKLLAGVLLLGLAGGGCDQLAKVDVDKDGVHGEIEDGAVKITPETTVQHEAVHIHGTATMQKGAVTGTGTVNLNTQPETVDVKAPVTVNPAPNSFGHVEIILKENAVNIRMFDEKAAEKLADAIKSLSTPLNAANQKLDNAYEDGKRYILIGSGVAVTLLVLLFALNHWRLTALNTQQKLQYQKETEHLKAALLEKGKPT